MPIKCGSKSVVFSYLPLIDCRLFQIIQEDLEKLESEDVWTKAAKLLNAYKKHFQRMPRGELREQYLEALEVLEMQLDFHRREGPRRRNDED
jgi:hypothetical protein